VLALNAPEWFSILLGSITSLVYGAVTPCYALIFSLIFGLFSQDEATAKHNSRNYSIMVFCVGIIGGLCQFISSYALARSGEALTVRMRVMSFATMLRQEMAWFDEETNQQAILISRLSKDAAALKGMTGVTIGAFLNAIGTLLAALAISFSAGWKLTLILLCFTPLIVLTGFMLGQKLSKAGQKKAVSTYGERGTMVSNYLEW
jgi:ABC-type multidrug transport system fused ATPase/permease subunit